MDSITWKVFVNIDSTCLMMTMMIMMTTTAAMMMLKLIPLTINVPSMGNVQPGNTVSQSNSRSFMLSLTDSLYSYIRLVVLQLFSIRITYGQTDKSTLLRLTT